MIHQNMIPEFTEERKPVFNAGVNIELHQQEWEAIAQGLMVYNKNLAEYIFDELGTSAEEWLTIYGLIESELEIIIYTLNHIAQRIKQQHEEQTGIK